MERRQWSKVVGNSLIYKWERHICRRTLSIIGDYLSRAYHIRVIFFSVVLIFKPVIGAFEAVPMDGIGCKPANEGNPRK